MEEIVIQYIGGRWSGSLKALRWSVRVTLHPLFGSFYLAQVVTQDQCDPFILTTAWCAEAVKNFGILASKEDGDALGHSLQLDLGSLLHLFENVNSIGRCPQVFHYCMGINKQTKSVAGRPL